MAHVTEHFGQALAGRIDAMAVVSRALLELRLDFDAALETTARIVGEFLGDACLIMLLTEDAQTLRVVSVYPSDSNARALIADTHRHPIDVRDGPFGPVVQRRLPLAMPVIDPKRLGLSDASACSSYWARHKMKSLVCLPIVAEAKTQGVLALFRRAQGHPFAPGELSLLQTLADRIALTLESARLRESIQTLTQERDHTLTRLQEAEMRSRRLVDATDSCAVFTPDPSGAVMAGYGTVGPDITERVPATDLLVNAELEARVKTRTSELSAALRERGLLLQEIHHRVKNNLQVVASLINMQLRRLADVPARRALEECRARIQAIALIHEMLYQDADYAKVPFSKYAHSLANGIFSTAEISPATVSLEIAIDDIDLPVDKAIPCGLVLNELITNALKYAFPDGRRGTIRVECAHCPDGDLRLRVADTGVGLPSGFDMASSKSFGLQLVQMLAEQLDARLLVRNQQGASFQLTFCE